MHVERYTLQTGLIRIIVLYISYYDYVFFVRWWPAACTNETVKN